MNPRPAECPPLGPPPGLNAQARPGLNPLIGPRGTPCDPQFGPKTWFLPVNGKAALTAPATSPTPPPRFAAITSFVIVATVTVPDAAFGTWLRVRVGLMDPQLGEAIDVGLYFGGTLQADSGIVGVMYDPFWFPLHGRAPAKTQLSIRARLKQPYHSAGSPTPTKPIRSLVTAFAELVLAVESHGTC